MLVLLSPSGPTNSVFLSAQEGQKAYRCRKKNDILTSPTLWREGLLPVAENTKEEVFTSGLIFRL